MSLTHKAINFDLSTNELKKYFEHTAEPYSLIKDFMLKNGFEHRQYSGYVSKEVMDEKQIELLTKRLSKNFSWLSSCVQKFDVTDIGRQYDLTHLLTNKTLHKDLKKNPKIQDSAIKRMQKKIEEIGKNLSKDLNKNSKKSKDLGR